MSCTFMESDEFLVNFMFLLLFFTQVHKMAFIDTKEVCVCNESLKLSNMSELGVPKFVPHCMQFYFFVSVTDLFPVNFLL